MRFAQPVFICLSLLLVARSALSQTISCGETKVSTSDSGHNVLAYYSFSATEGDMISFVSRVSGTEEIGISIWQPGVGRVVYVENETDGSARICGWEAPATAS